MANTEMNYVDNNKIDISELLNQDWYVTSNSSTSLFSVLFLFGINTIEYRNTSTNVVYIYNPSKTRIATASASMSSFVTLDVSEYDYLLFRTNNSNVSLRFHVLN